MTTVWEFAGVSFLALVLFAPRAQAQETRTIYLVRHADRASEDIDSRISDAGRARAECLADTLRDARIQQIFVSDLQRTQQTAAPLAARLHLKPVVMPLARPEDLAAAILTSAARSVLVIWHDATLPGILRSLGAPEIAPIAHTEYDRFFVVTLAGNGKTLNTGFAALRYCDCAK
jgi:phosphohistidine phosphatase SixA